MSLKKSSPKGHRVNGWSPKCVSCANSWKSINGWQVEEKGYRSSDVHSAVNLVSRSARSDWCIIYVHLQVIHCGQFSLFERIGQFTVQLFEHCQISGFRLLNLSSVESSEMLWLVNLLPLISFLIRLQFQVNCDSDSFQSDHPFISLWNILTDHNFYWHYKFSLKIRYFGANQGNILL